MVEQRGTQRLKARVYLAFGNLAKPSTRHYRTSRALARQAFNTALQAGDLTYAGFSCNNVLTQLLAGGDPLAEVQREAEAGLVFARQARFGLVVDLITAQLGFVRSLRGQTTIFGSFNDAVFDEGRFEQQLDQGPRPSIAACLYWIRKLQARVFSGDHAAAVVAATKAEGLLWLSPVIFETAEYHLYAALACAPLCEAAPAAERSRRQNVLAAHHRQLRDWAEHCPENFASHATLVGAEIARLDGNELDAEQLYEQAIRSARANGLVHNEALASEIAARFYASRGLETNAVAHLRNARRCYRNWGADGKIRQLDKLYPHLREQEPLAAPSGTIETPVEHLDLATVLKVSQAISGEIALEKLIDTLLRTAIEQAGAERGLLILPRGGEQRIEAEAKTNGDIVIVHMRDDALAKDMLPESVLHHVLRTRGSVILDDAAADSSFATDPYICEQQARSILCLPLINQGKVNGVLYLENNLAHGVFAPSRIAVLRILASQAAISLENTHLYRDLAEREAKIRRLVDANIIGIFLWNLGGQIVEANDAFLRIVGYEREDIVSGSLYWKALTPSDWLERDEQRRVPELVTTGSLQPYEKEYCRKDGTRVPVLIGAASFEAGASEGVAFVLDLTERKQAEAALSEMRMQLTHANRIATMGQLTASIAHEVNQPIAATVTNALAARRWLGVEPPNLNAIQQALDRIVRDGNRAAAVVGRIRNLIKKAPPSDERVDINAAIREVIELIRSEATKNSVSVLTHLAQGLPLIQGDRVGLQQVMLNLILNAIEAIDEMGEGSRELLITTAKTESSDVLVAVRDSGPGLAPAALENLFKAFHTTKPNGLGLGLSICRSIIESHGGRLWASANSPTGAVFQFSVPAHRDVPT